MGDLKASAMKRDKLSLVQTIVSIWEWSVGLWVFDGASKQHISGQFKMIK